MRSNLLIGAAALASIAAATPALAVPNLVQNGGFESVTGGPGYSHEFGASYKYGQTVNNWTSSSTTAFNVLFYPGQANGPADASTRFDPTHPGGEHGQYLHQSTLSPDGGNFVALDGDTGSKTETPGVPIIGNGAGPIDQTITGLTSGKKYLLSFYYAGAQYADRTGPTTDQLFASLGSETHYTPVFKTKDSGFTGWRKGKFTFTATSDSEVLSFLANGAPSGLPPVTLLDGVNLSVAPDKVPEPAALALLGLGLAGIGAARLRRR